MSLEYKILWFEDNYDIVEEYSYDIKIFLEELGFNLNLVHREDGDDLEEVLSKEYDLVLTDLNLGEGVTGDRLIEEIRSHNILTEVLFYSGNAHGINNIIKKHEWIERVSFSVGIENLLEKVKQLISLTVRKLQDINMVRGLVMAETSELDEKMMETIKNILNTFDDHEIPKKQQELIDKVIKNRKERYEKIGKTTLETIEDFYVKLESYDKLNAVKRLLKHKRAILNEDNFRENIEILNSYESDVIKVRNSLAHAKQVEDNGVKKVVSTVVNAEINFDDDSCKKIRKDIKRHHDNLDKLNIKLQG